MNFISKLFKKKEEETEVVSKGSVEEFVTLIRVYYQAVMAVQLGITNLNILNDMALFKDPDSEQQVGHSREIPFPQNPNARIRAERKLFQGNRCLHQKELQDAERHQILFHHVSGIQ